jgi:hypothetical protein
LLASPAAPADAGSADAGEPAGAGTGNPAGAGGGTGDAAREAATPGLDGLLLTIHGPAAAPRVGETVRIEVRAEATVPIVDAPFVLLYDPAALLFTGAAVGEFLGRSGGQVVFMVNGESRPGEVTVGAGTTSRRRGALGRGLLCEIRFEALRAGSVRVGAGEMLAVSDRGRPVAVTAAPADLVILP